MIELTNFCGKRDLIRLLAMNEKSSDDKLLRNSDEILNCTGYDDNDHVPLKVIRNVLAQMFKDEVQLIYKLWKYQLIQHIEAIYIKNNH
jgi:hypothetical protein